MKIVEGQLYASKPELQLIRQACIASFAQPELYLHHWLDSEQNPKALSESLEDDSGEVHDVAFLRRVVECWQANKYTEVEE